MKNLIIRTNEWFENLTPIKALSVYLPLLLIPYVLLICSLPMPYGPIIAVLWTMVPPTWRLSYTFIKRDKLNINK